MGERTEYAPGTFSWTDLSTPDLEAATAFYSGLFGWEAEDMPAGEAGIYRMFSLDGRNVAAAYEQPEDQRAQGLPPSWLCYVTVDGLAESARRAGELGGTVIAEPFDVMEAGRMAVVADPAGAMFLMWEPRRHPGAELVNVPGALTWNDLHTRDLEGAKRFYSELFGWTTQDVGTPPVYTAITNRGHGNGGMRVMSAEEEGIPPWWMPYFGAEDCDASVATAEELGGRVVVPITEVPAGRFAVMADPQGAMFALFQGDLDS